MRTTINVDDSIFENIISFTNARTKAEAVNRDLAEYVRLKIKERLVGLSGKIRVESNIRKLREMEKLPADSR